MRLSLPLLFLLALPLYAHADDAPAPDDLGVLVQKAAGDGVNFAHGSGVYIGKDEVLTAAHVVRVDRRHNDIVVLLDGILAQGKVTVDGDDTKGPDLALIKLKPELVLPKRRAQKPVEVCTHNAGLSEPVTVVSGGKVTNSAIISKPIMAQNMKLPGDGTNFMVTDYGKGNSGGGVFDPVSGCLFGIVSFEAGGTDNNTGNYVVFTGFVPASDIAPFLKSA